MSTRNSSLYPLTASCFSDKSPTNTLQLQHYDRTSLRLDSIDMSPMPVMHKLQYNEGLDASSGPNALEQTTNAVTNALRLIVILLGVVTLSFIAVWAFARVRLRWKRPLTGNLNNGNTGYEARYSPSSLGVEIFESDISIDMIAEDGDIQSSGTEFDDLSDQGEMETIVSSASATRMNFTLENLPNMMRGGILERRGRKNTLRCDTTAYYEFDAHRTQPGPESAVPETKKSVTRPVFGFHFQEITPPVGSPLWNRKMDVPRATMPGPLTHPPKFA